VHDVLVIGAGVAGLCQLHQMRAAGHDVLAIEAGSDVGGTWYWNRYPGARFDSESYTYGYSFDPELLAEWEWSERFSPQPETLRYLQHVADRFDLRRHIRFDTRVVAAHWHEDERCWEVTTDAGDTLRARWLITAVGVLSQPTYPAIEGRDDYAGIACHTARWPHEGVELAGRRVGVIGTGATGVQVIQEAAKVASHLSVFQRTPNWCAPLHNSPITEAEQAHLRETMDEILEQCRQSFGGFIHDALPTKTSEVDDEERLALWERLYGEPGFGICFANYRDVLMDEHANRLLSDFAAAKIAERVHDPEIAARLTPVDHGFGTRRLPLETKYYEVYNQPNVELVDVRETPIERITPTGVRTTAGHHDVDVLVYATGFDAITGAFRAMDIRGTDGRALRDTWADGAFTFLGLLVPGFPNLFTIAGPHSVTTFCNMPRCIEQNVDWITALVERASQRGATRVEATTAAASEWTEHTYSTVDRLLMSKVDSWFNGVNANLPDRPRRALVYGGGLPRYRERCDEVAERDYEGIDIS
jgi:cation diffusion facilitator CzcD-associated flavoprotein CzcO